MFKVVPFCIVGDAELIFYPNIIERHAFMAEFCLPGDGPSARRVAHGCQDKALFLRQICPAADRLVVVIKMMYTRGIVDLHPFLPV